MSQVFSSGGGGSNSIQQLESDPASPAAEEVWVLKAGGAGGSLQWSILQWGLMLGGGPVTYTLKYRTIEGTTVSVALT